MDSTQRKFDMKTGAALVSAAAMLGCASARHELSEGQACELVKAQIAEIRLYPKTVPTFCDHVAPDASPPEFYVLALHSYRDCDGICSTNLGWFAVHKSTGQVFNWNVTDLRVGTPVSSR